MGEAPEEPLAPEEPDEPEEVRARGESAPLTAFRQMMEEMEEWGREAADHLEQAVLETMAAAANVERALQERPPPPELPFVEPEAPDHSLSMLDLDLDFEGAAPKAEDRHDDLSFLAELAAEARAAAQEQIKLSSVETFERSEAACEAGEACEVFVGNTEKQCEWKAATSCSWRSLFAATSQHPALADQAPVDSPTPPAEPVDPGESLEALERKIEEERLACLEQLERQHQALVEQMRQEELERRQMEARLKEEVRMHREELHCREFYRQERGFQRQEARAMRLEDQHARHVRDEERRMLEDADRTRADAERRKMEVEDALATAVRRRAREQRELRLMGAEDARSAEVETALRLAWERRGLATADAQSRTWRDLGKEAEESERMSAEDRRSNAWRLCTCDFAQEVKSRRSAQSAQSAEEVLSKMVTIGEKGRSKGSGETRGPVAGGQRSGLDASELNPWSLVERSPGKARRASKSTEVRTCGAAVCQKLWEGNAKRRGRRRPTPSVSRAPEPPRLGRRAPGLADLALEGLNGGLEELILGPASQVRLEVKMEGLTRLPQLSPLPDLRILVLSGNKISGSLEALRHCSKLEELDVCQNALTSLDGLRHLPYLSVLKATMNEISDAEDLALLPRLRVLELSKNRLTSAPLRSSCLAKLDLYRNSLDSMSFLQELPSLTQLDLGRNKITELDPNISQWTPLLSKAFLYENRLASLPELHLPLLTDLWVDNNQLETLGYLGFLPSLERLQAKHNRIRSLASPIAASPLLKTLELAFNQLGVGEPPKTVPLLPRLAHLQLNDNPVAAELMEEYRPWVLRMSPQLEELDNDTVSEEERRRAVAPSRHSQRPTRDAAAAGAGLLGLVACKAPAQRPPADPPETCEGDVPAPARTTGASTAARWAAAWRGGGTAPDVAESGCQMCALAAWCEALSRNRSGALVAHVVQERWTGQLLANPNTARLQEEVLFALRRRHDFWTAFLDLCGAQHDSLAVWPNPRGAVLRELQFEALGYAKSTAAVLVKAQARWRGVKARRSFRQLRLEQICQTLPQSQLGQLTKVQALWRGQRRRSSLRAQGVVLPLDRRSAKLKRAATQLQAALRGSRVRRKLRWAREVSRMVGDDLEDPTADLQELLAAAQSAAAEPLSFHLSLPQGASLPLSRASASAAPAPAPMVAWSTPPSTSAGRFEDRPEIREGPRVEEADCGSVASPHSSRPDSGVGPRRSRSLSSTAESAMTEAEGPRSRAQHMKEEWGFKDIATARNAMNAQRRRPKPPTLPGGPSSSHGRPTGTPTRKSSSLSATKRRGAAQEAILEYQRQQEAEQSAAEFCSGSPNRKLMRSSKSLF